MKTAKLIIGIISIVLSFLVLFQSCAAGIGDAIVDEGGTSGSSGMVVGIIMLISGIVAIATRTSRGGAIFCTVLYAIAGLLGINSNGIFKDLIVWGVLCLIFAAIFFVSVIKTSGTSNSPDTASKIQGDKK